MPVYNLPMNIEPTLSQTADLEPEHARLRAKGHVSDIMNEILGPMPLFEFIDHFLPVVPTADDHSHRLPSRDAFKLVPYQAKRAADIYEPLVPLPEPTRSHEAPRLLLQAVQCDRRARSSRIDFGYAELFIDICPDPQRDLFHDPPPDATDRHTHELLSRLADRQKFLYVQDMFGQHVAYVVEVFARQSRHFLFTVAMHGSRVRLLHWDHAGCVVSEAFDIRTDPDILCEFLWRFSQATDSGRGHDTTVEYALPEEEGWFRDGIREYMWTQLNPGEDLEHAVKQHYAPGQLFATNILYDGLSADEGHTRRFIFSRPVVSSRWLAGPGTRGYWAYDVWTKNVVFLKDTWRYSTHEIEGDIVRRLWDIGVRNVPSFVWHGDVSGLDRYPEPPRPLDPMNDTLEKDSRIHRDISTGNIILVREPNNDIRKGYLIDWETSCRVDEHGDAVEPGRVGTWKFTSIRLLEWDWGLGINPRHTFLDDMESMLYVVIYSAFLWQPHDLPRRVLDSCLLMFNFEFKHPGGYIFGGTCKTYNATGRDYTNGVEFDSLALREWLDAMMAFHAPLHSHGDEFRGKWTAAHVDKFWTDFLATHALEPSNRAEHVLDHIDDCDTRSMTRWTVDWSPRHSPSCEPSTATEAMMAVKEPSSKRQRSSSPSAQPARKKRAKAVGYSARSSCVAVLESRSYGQAMANSRV
ncbi:uncharacterized protein BXZ73DRAFT_107312 [Epithele typhae]|uniref:uncharacterized protein n=1 Tax=Epithele typhae TaxID=378194 RepID=UPI0020086DD4|nr:uncharacterized protein BXZ73DRAFT_107312 [Epithele typhae]KAH9912676.1 hypothetical protein BXZ73DRAFT_107312 [Epithele typhae]